MFWIRQARKFGPGCPWSYRNWVPPRQVKPKPFEVGNFDNINILLAGPELRGDLEQASFTAQPEAAEAFRKWRGIGQKGHFCI